MNHSYLLPQGHGRIVLANTVRQHLRLRSNCLLHGTIVHDTVVASGTEHRDASAVLSPIPFEHWDRCYRLRFVTAAESGRLAAACAALSELDLNILVLNSTAANLQGSLATTVILEAPHSTSELDGNDTTTDDLRGKIQDQLNQHDALMRRGSTHRVHRLSDVHLVPLSVLRGMKAMKGDGERVFSTLVHNSVLDLEYDERDGLYQHLARHRLCQHSGTISVAMTIDTEECYMRLWLVPERELHQLHLTYSLRHAAQSVQNSLNATPGFPGVFQRLLELIGKPPLHANLFHVEQHLLAKFTDPSTEEDVERVHVVVVGDTACCEAGKTTASINEAFTSTLNNWQADLKSSDIAVEYDPADLEVHRLPTSIVPVFLSTNAKPQMADKHLDIARYLTNRLRSIGLYPVNVDVSEGGPLLDEVTRLLELCPLVVSLHLPEPSLKLHDAHGSQYTVSPWVVFEESFALSRRPGRYCIRLRHEEVKAPPYAHGMVHDVFTDDANNYKTRINHAIQRIQSIRTTADWRRTIEQMRREHLIIESLAKYDIDRWLQSSSSTKGLGEIEAKPADQSAELTRPSH